MDKEYLKTVWKQEEEAAHIRGWDFSYIQNRYTAENDLPWDYGMIVRQYLKSSMDMLDYDTGGGEFLLSLQHPYNKTSATEGYSPNVLLCCERLLPLGINFRECNDPKHIPFEDEAFDMIINRHGSFDAAELFRLLRQNGLFITEQVGEDNDRDLVKMVLPEAKKPFPHMNLTEQRQFHHIHVKSVHIPQAYRHQHLYGSRGGKSRPVGNISGNQNVKTVINTISFLSEGPEYAFQIIGPPVSAVILQIIQGRFDHTHIGKIHGIKPEFSVLPLSGHAISAQRQRAGKHMSAVVIRMFSDQIDPARCKIAADIAAGAI